MGKKDRVYNLVTKYTFKRSVGVLTDTSKSNKSTTNCPNCGGTLNITSAGRCEWCRSVVTTGSHDWVLNDIVKISQ